MTGVRPFRERDPRVILPGVCSCFNMYFFFGCQIMVFSSCVFYFSLVEIIVCKYRAAIFTMELA